MALTTYAELVSAVQNWMGQRTDLATDVPDFIALTEADLNNTPDFRLSEMEETASLLAASFVSGGIALPADYLEWREVKTTNTPYRALDYVTPDWGDENYLYAESATPTFFTIRDGQLFSYPITTLDLTLIYYKKIPALSASNTTNWLLSMYPNIYLFGALKYAAVRTQDDPSNYAQMMSEAVQRAIAQDKGRRYARAAIRPRGLTP